MGSVWSSLTELRPSLKMAVLAALAVVVLRKVLAKRRSLKEFSTTLHHSEHAYLYRDVIEACPTLHALEHGFRPLSFASGAYAQTLWTVFRSNPDVHYRKELLLTPDGGTLALDWLGSVPVGSQPRTVVIIYPGLTGSSESAYIRTFSLQCTKKIPGACAVVLNHRGLGGAPVTAKRLQVNGRRATDTIRGRYPATHVLAIGFSLGSNILVKYLGEEGEKSKIDAAISVSNPFDFIQATRTWTGWKFNTLINYPLTKLLVSLVKPMLPYFVEQGVPINTEALLQCKTVWDFDDKFTIIVAGYGSVEEYYSAASCARVLHRVAVPLLCINALDDPLCPPHAIPIDDLKTNPHILLACSKFGGHVAWLEHSWSWHKLTWMDRVCGEFLAAVSQKRARQ